MRRLVGCAQVTDDWPGLQRATGHASRSASLTGALQRMTGRRQPKHPMPAIVTSQPSQASVNAPGSAAAPSLPEPDAGRDGNGAHTAARQRRTRKPGP